MSQNQLDNYLSIAVQAVSKALILLRLNKDYRTKTLKSDGKDIKLQADIELQNEIFKILKEQTNLDILGEEEKVKSLMTTKDPIWIVDPIDGTFNFYRGLSHSCISIGLWQENKPLLGVVYDINSHDLYSGIVGEKAYKNKSLISVSNTEYAEDAAIFTGFPVYSSFTDQSINGFIVSVKRYKKVRMIGSAALSLCFVAEGCADVYQENNIGIWDVAGAIPIVLAAGGSVNIQDGSGPHFRNVYASNGKIKAI
jgi:myo-inositol-1(or 4)-monophosphatase